MTLLKTVSYRGGIASFDIPASWKEEYEPSGGATFYEDRPDSGTLRLNVLSFLGKAAETCDDMISSLIAASGYLPLQQGLAIKESVKPAMEEAVQLQVHSWSVAVPVAPRNIRLAVFTYTILSSQAEEPLSRDEIAMISESIRTAAYSCEQGSAGDY